MTATDIQNLIAMYYRALKGGLIEHHELPQLYTAVENAKKYLQEQLQQNPPIPSAQPEIPADIPGKPGENKQ